MHFVSLKSWKKLPFELNVFNDGYSHGKEYTNIFLEGGYQHPNFYSLVPFEKLSQSYWWYKTPLKKNDELPHHFGFRNIWVKDESYNPYGTHKDRRSEYIINVALEQGVDKIVCLTAWNAGYSLSRYCARAGIDYTSLVFPWVSEARKRVMEEWWGVVMIDGQRYRGILRPRDFIKIVEEYDFYERGGKKWKNPWAVTNSFEPISVNAYKEIIYEVVQEVVPDYIVVPCGSGDIIVWIWLAIQELNLDTKIIAVGPQDEHPLKYALEQKNDQYTIQEYKEDSLAEKLSTPFTAVLPFLYEIFTNPKHLYIEVSNEEIKKAREITEMCGVRCENSSAVWFAGLLWNNKLTISQDAKIIVVNTGKGVEV